MEHLDLILTEHDQDKIRLSLVGDVLPAGAFSERIVVDRAEIDVLSERLTRDLMDWSHRPAQIKPGPPIRETLAQSGLALFQALFGRSGDELRSLKHLWGSQERYCLLHLDEELVHIPVELCHDGDAFLCESFLLGRRVAAARAQHLAAPQRTDRPRVVLIANPSEDPCLSDSAEQELAQVRKTLAETRTLDVRPYVGRAVEERTLDELLPGAAAVHFIGHADSPPDEPGRNGWRLFKSRWYGSDRVLRLQNPPGIVFANACATARTADWKGAMPLVRAFLERGTQAYVGTWWEVGSPAAAGFAQSFYRALTEGETVGQALARARCDSLNTFGPEDASWASYVLYGDPRTRLPRAAEFKPVARARIVVSAAIAALAIALVILVPTALEERTGGPETQQEEGVVVQGYLTFRSDPVGATVRVDGQARGVTPCTLEMDEGTYDVTIELPGYRTWAASTIVDPRRPREIRAELQRIQ